jgi:hypothetical protein
MPRVIAKAWAPYLDRLWERDGRIMLANADLWYLKGRRYRVPLVHMALLLADSPEAHSDEIERKRRSLAERHERLAGMLERKREAEAQLSRRAQ